jgi:hypothetical protein
VCWAQVMIYRKHHSLRRTSYVFVWHGMPWTGPN